jgi:methionyl-tRNA synthetase
MEQDLALWSAVHGSVEEVAKHVDAFRFRDALASAMNVARAGNKYLSDHEPWKLEKTDPERTRTILSNSLNVVAVLSVVLEPFLPFTAEKLRMMLGLGALEWDDALRSDLIPAGIPLGKPEHLFKPIDDAAIQAEVDRLHANRPMEATPEQSAKPTVADPSLQPAKANITFDDFAKLDLRTGRILAAEKVEKADKLLKLTIDIGEGSPRTVISGIALHFTPDQVVGEQVVLVANLEPRKMRGVESQGMVLMAEDAKGKLVFVRPSEVIPPGSGVR